MANYTIGLAGLQNTSLAIDTTSNNIANADTVGYKAGDYVFADQYFKAVSPSDSNRVGLGSERLAVRRPLTYGTINNSANPLDMAIGGDGWFRMLTNPSDPTSVNYTRNGQFAVDKNGWIVNENGMYLTGYQPAPDGKTVTDDIRGLGTTNGKLRMPPDFANGVQTQTSTINAVLDSRENAFVKGGGVAFDAAQPGTYNSKTTQTIFDSNGASHTLEVYYRRITDSTLKITSNGSGGYTYSPGPTSSPNTLSATSVSIPMNSSLTVQSAATNTFLGSSLGVANAGTGGITSLPFISQSTTADINANDKIYINGVDSGLTVVGSTITKGTAISSLTIAGAAVAIPANASISIYKGDVTTPSAVAWTIASDKKSFTVPTGTISPSLAGSRLFIGGVDTGVTISSVTTGNTSDTVALSDALPSTFSGPTAVLTLKQSLAMTLTAPDGTQIAVQGTTNKQNSNSVLLATQSNIETYASIDGVFYSPTNTGNNPSSNFKTISAETSGAPGYQPVALMGFVGGRNIDSLVVDAASGKPLFKTDVKLTSQVSNGTQQSDTIPLIYDLDLSGTQLQASSFQVNSSVQDGEPRSQLASVSIDSSGTIVGVYGNGRQIVAGQIALAHFDASEQLVPTGGNSFAPSYRSGTEGDNGVRIGRPGEGSFGAIKSQAVEQSNVDLSNELVKLMLLQREYSANSQSLRAFDQTMQDTIRMVG